MSWLYVALLAAAVVVVAAAEWPRLTARLGAETRARRARERRKANLRVLRTEDDDSDDFAASVQRDLANLPTTKERDRS